MLVRNLRLWFGVPAVVVGAVVGLLTNIVSSSPTWPLILGLVFAVGVWVVLTVWQAGRDEQTRRRALRAARAQVLEPLIVAAPTLGSHTASSLLAAEHALAPFRARGDETHELLSWCQDHSGSVVRVLAGPSGVGKSRLAVEVARQLLPPWTAGRCISGRAGELIPAVAACGEPTLAIVDDADTQPDVAELVRHTHELETHEKVKVLLVVRDAAVFEQWIHQQLPDHHRQSLPSMSLRNVGTASDRPRWFAEAVQAYATALGKTPPVMSSIDRRPVGTDGETMVVLQVRAVLAALSDSPERVDAMRTASLSRCLCKLSLGWSSRGGVLAGRGRPGRGRRGLVSSFGRWLLRRAGGGRCVGRGEGFSLWRGLGRVCLRCRGWPATAA